MMKLNKTTIKNYKDFCEINSVTFKKVTNNYIRKSIFDIHLRKEKINKNDPDLYFVDVFDGSIKDNNKAYQEDLSNVFNELYQAIEHLEDVLHIPKRITKQIKGI